ncbi:MlaC/ttg2D family ABC transporter substrate-binding protein [Cochlodiniinecator piscidefendens]|uniref:MlaC/ttg2D family ABC transporter substrate-binding protein n=1 Tax=Cochlodiniinecator piscidefendens TaxID=2715756 RepID=UPI00140A0C46|nr:ABC transporter substrate-binding protein [Cochlodiniinecator piscidefendens]
MKRREFVKSGLAVGALGMLPLSAQALTPAQAEGLVAEVINRIQGIINSGNSESRMLRDFEGIFSRYGNTRVIALRVLGNDGRSASDSQKRAFVEAFQGYIGRKYGRRFREFIGATLEIEGARRNNSWIEVETSVALQGQAPFRVDFFVREAGNQNLFFDMVIEGISLTRVEREEIGAMLDRRGGDLNRLIADLRNAG